MNTTTLTSSATHNPFLFVVGCPRSGTTLLQRMLDSHPQLAVANDTHFIPRAIESLYPAVMVAAVNEGAIPLTNALVDWVRNYHRFYRLELNEEAICEAAQSSTFGEFVSALYTAFAKLHGKIYGGEKTPDYVRHLALLHRMFPRSKSIQIYRDGRDVALSLLEWASEKQGPRRFKLWETEPMAVCALWWRWQVSTGRRDGQLLGPKSYSEIGYEELVAQPEQALQRLTTFLELPFAEDMLTFFAGKTRESSGLSAKSAWLPPTRGLRDWRTQMSPRNIELFEALAGDLLTELGYQRSVDTISPEVVQLAAECNNWWITEIRRKEAKLVRRAEKESLSTNEQS